MKQPQIPPPLNDLLFRHQSNLSDILQGNLGVMVRPHCSRRGRALLRAPDVIQQRPPTARAFCGAGGGGRWLPLGRKRRVSAPQPRQPLLGGGTSGAGLAHHQRLRRLQGASLGAFNAAPKGRQPSACGRRCRHPAPTRIAAAGTRPHQARRPCRFHPLARDWPLPALPALAPCARRAPSRAWPLAPVVQPWLPHPAFRRWRRAATRQLRRSAPQRLGRVAATPPMPFSVLVTVMRFQPVVSAICFKDLPSS